MKTMGDDTAWEVRVIVWIVGFAVGLRLGIEAFFDHTDPWWTICLVIPTCTLAGLTINLFWNAPQLFWVAIYGYLFDALMFIIVGFSLIEIALFFPFMHSSKEAKGIALINLFLGLAAFAIAHITGLKHPLAPSDRR